MRIIIKNILVVWLFSRLVVWVGIILYPKRLNDQSPKQLIFIFYGRRPHFFPLGIFIVLCVALRGRRAMRSVRLGVMSSAHISTDEQDTSWLPTADTHNEMHFYPFFGSHLLHSHGDMQRI